MIFVAAFTRHGLPPDVLDHMAEHWKDPVPFDRPIFVINPSTLEARKITGDFYASNIQPRPRKDRRNHGRII